jgi:hypothetical protein
MSKGSVTSAHNGVTVLKDIFTYPLAINLTFTNTNFSDCESLICTVFNADAYQYVVEATVDHSYNRELLPAPFLLGSTISERQRAGEP